MESLEVEVDVNESYIAKVLPGQKVRATLDAYPDWTIPCSVRTVIPTADRQKATVKVRIAFDALDPRILPDMGAKVAFLAESDPGTPPVGSLVPKEAVREDSGAKIAFVLRDGRLSRRSVTVGEIYGTEVNLTSGVAPGEAVVVSGPEGMADGMRAAEKK
jgi:multidrug efflux pump subunit AcrA (membrane-fusion protein)